MAIEPLRSYQEEDLPFFLVNPRSMILYEPRMGKTVIACNVMAHDNDCERILIVCPKNAMGVWYDHIKEWFAYICPEFTLDIRLVRGKGSKASFERNKVWTNPIRCAITVWIVTFGALDRDIEFLQLPSTIKSGLTFDTVIGDEIHRRLRNRKNKTTKYIKWLCRPQVCKRVHMLSGTMAGKGGPQDFWAVLNILNPGEFSSFWRYANQWCETTNNGFGMEIIGPKNLRMFHQNILDRYSRRRFRKDTKMPKIQRSLKKVEATTEQLKIVHGLQTDSLAWIGDKLIVAATSLEAVLRKRQVLTCPKLLNPELGYGAALEDLIEYLTDEDNELSEDDKHIVIFSDFRKALPWFEHALKGAGFENVWQLYGGMEFELQQERINLFRKTKGIILCSTQYAQAFSLVPATQCFHIGYAWDPNDNKQAEDRLVPQEGENPIDSYYYGYRGIDEGIAESVSIKNKLISLTIGSAASLNTGDSNA